MSGIPLEHVSSNLSLSSTSLSTFNTSGNNSTNIANQKGPTINSFPPAHQLFSYGNKSNHQSHLSALHDETSTYPAVSKACIYLSQFSASHSSDSCNVNDLFENECCQDGTNAYTHASLYHIPTYTRQISSSIEGLRKCASNHLDRRCRILALKCLSIVSRNMFAKLRFSGALTSVLLMDEYNDNHYIQNNAADIKNYEGSNITVARVEDECSNEAAITLANAAIMEEDEGISGAAIEGLAILVCSHKFTDVINDEIKGILFNNAPQQNQRKYRFQTEEQHAMMDLQERVLENVIPSRMRRMIHRFTLYTNTKYIIKALPFFSSAFTYYLTISSLPQLKQTITLKRFAKRWYEMDIMSMLIEVVQSILIPGMVKNLDRGFQLACALCVVRLVDAYAKCNNGSIDELNGSFLCRLAAEKICENCFAKKFKMISRDSEQFMEADLMEDKLFILAEILISTRVMRLAERPDILLQVIEDACSLPALINAPKYVDCSSWKVMHMTHKLMQKLVRLGLFVEISLSIFIDGLSSTSLTEERPAMMKYILTDNAVQSMLQDRLQKYKKHEKQDVSGLEYKNEIRGDHFTGPHVGEDLVYSFCSVATLISSQIYTASRGQRRQSIPIMKEWIRCSIIILANLSVCLTWKYDPNLHSSTSTFEDPSSHTRTATESYLSLFGMCLSKLNLISPQLQNALTYIIPSYNSFSSLSPPQSSAKTLAGDTNDSSIFGNHCAWAIKDLSKICDQIIERRICEHIPSVTIRICLLSMFANVWANQYGNVTAKSISRYTSVEEKMHDSHTIKIIQMFGEAIADLVEKSEEQNSLNLQDLNLTLLCIYSVEGMVLEARNHHSATNSEESSEIDTSLNRISSLVMAALDPELREAGNKQSMTQPQNHSFPPDSTTFKMLEHCKAARKRVRAVLNGRASPSTVPFWGTSKNVKELFNEMKGTTFSMPFHHDLDQILTTPENNNSSGNPQQTPIKMDRVGSSSSVSNYHFEEGLYWQQARILSISRTSWALHYSPFGTKNIPMIYPGGGASPTAQTGNGKEDNRLVTRPVVPINLLRLPQQSCIKTCADIPESMFDKIQTISGCSDPLSIIMAYGLRKIDRYDGEEEFHVLVTIRVTNITPVPLSEGLRLELSALRSSFEVEGKNKPKNLRSTFNLDEIPNSSQSTISTSALYKAELCPYESLTWEVILHQWEAGNLELSLSAHLTMQAEIPTHRWIPHNDERIKITDDDSKSTSPTMEIDEGDRKESNLRDALNLDVEENGHFDDQYLEDEVLDMVLTCDPVLIDGSIILQPCPLVFSHGLPDTHKDRIQNELRFRSKTMNEKNNITYNNGPIGDENVFWFLWSNMPCETIEFEILHRQQHGKKYERKKSSFQDTDGLSQMMIENSSFLVQDNMAFVNEKDPMKAWAFITWCGDRILCLESNIAYKNHGHDSTPETLRVPNNKDIRQRRKLEIKGDNLEVLLSFLCSHSSRNRFVENLKGHGWICHEDKHEDVDKHFSYMQTPEENRVQKEI